MKAKKSSSSEPTAFLPALDSQLSNHMLIFHWQLPFKCQFTSRCWEAAFVSLIKSQRGKVWGLSVLGAGWDRAAAAAESGRPWPTRMVRVKCTAKDCVPEVANSLSWGAVAAKGNLFLALSGGKYDLVDDFRLFGMAGSGQDRGKTLGYKRRQI